MKKYYPRNSNGFAYLFSVYVRKYWDKDADSIIYNLIHMDEFNALWDEFCNALNYYLYNNGNSWDLQTLSETISGWFWRYTDFVYDYYVDISTSIPKKDGSQRNLQTIFSVALRMISEDDLQGFVEDVFENSFYEKGHTELTKISKEHWGREIDKYRNELKWSNFDKIFDAIGIYKKDRPEAYERYARFIERKIEES